MEQELQQLLEKRAQRDIGKQQATAEAPANRHAQENATEKKAAQDAAMSAHLEQQAMAAALAVRATPEEAIIGGQASSIATQAMGPETTHD